MIRETSTYLVKNRSAGRVCYTIPELGVRRTFAPGETQKIPYSELVKLTYQPGGKNLLVSFLQVQAAEVLESFNMNVQPEYYMDENQVKELLLHGSQDAFLDCLDFAPTGVIDMVKKFAVELPLSDYEKREAMKEKIGFDVDKALANKKQEEEEAKNPGGFVATGDAKTEEAAPAKPTGRRTSVTYKTPLPRATKTE